MTEVKSQKILLSKQAKKRIFIACMLSWSIAHFLVFWLYMNFNTILMTFQRFNVLTAKEEWYGFVRYERIFKDMFLGQDIFLKNSLKNSLLVFPVNNLIILPLSFIASYFLFKKVPFSNTFRVIFFFPSIVSIIVLTMSFRFMFHTDFGTFSMLLKKVFGISPDYFSSMSPTAIPMVFIFCVWAGLGYNIILMSGAMARIPTDILEYGSLDGVGPFRELIMIILPLIWPTLSTLIILNTLGVFGFFIQPMLLIGPDGGYMGNGSTVALRVMYFIKAGAGNEAAAIGLMFSIFGVPFIMLFKWALGKISADVEF